MSPSRHAPLASPVVRGVQRSRRGSRHRSRFASMDSLARKRIPTRLSRAPKFGHPQRPRTPCRTSVNSWMSSGSIQATSSLRWPRYLSTEALIPIQMAHQYPTLTSARTGHQSSRSVVPQATMDRSWATRTHFRNSPDELAYVLLSFSQPIAVQGVFGSSRKPLVPISGQCLPAKGDACLAIADFHRNVCSLFTPSRRPRAVVRRRGRRPGGRPGGLRRRRAGSDRGGR